MGLCLCALFGLWCIRLARQLTERFELWMKYDFATVQWGGFTASYFVGDLSSRKSRLLMNCGGAAAILLPVSRSANKPGSVIVYHGLFTASRQSEVTSAARAKCSGSPASDALE